MKYLINILAAALLVACGGGGDSAEPQTASAAIEVPAAQEQLASGAAVAISLADVASASDIIKRDLPDVDAAAQGVEFFKGARREIEKPGTGAAAMPSPFDYATGPIPSLVIMGDSLASEEYSVWGARLRDDLAPRVMFYKNIAVPGQPCLYDGAYAERRSLPFLKPGGTVIWLCGSNDIAKGFGDKGTTLGAIKLTHKLMVANGQRLIVATVPPSYGWCYHSFYDCHAARLEHNRNLKAWAAEKNVPILLLDELFPNTDDSYFYKDGLHYVEEADNFIARTLGKFF